MKSQWILNTSNQGKLREFQRLFAQYKIHLIPQQIDLKEVESDSITVVVHKASQVKEGVLVEDTSLHVDGASVGIHVRYLLEHLAQYVGRKAEWQALLAYQKKGQVYVYEGTISGRIVQPKGEGGFGFDSFFLPDNSECTLAESKPDGVNARAKVVDSFVHDRTLTIVSPITHWNGPWQNMPPNF